MVDLDAIKVVLQRVGGGLECSRSLVDEAKGQLKLVEEKFTSTNTESKPYLCVTCSRLESNGGTCSPNTHSFVTECGGYSGTAHVS